MPGFSPKLGDFLIEIFLQRAEFNSDFEEDEIAKEDSEEDEVGVGVYLFVLISKLNILEDLV